MGASQLAGLGTWRVASAGESVVYVRRASCGGLGLVPTPVAVICKGLVGGARVHVLPCVAGNGSQTVAVQFVSLLSWRIGFVCLLWC